MGKRVWLLPFFISARKWYGGTLEGGNATQNVNSATVDTQAMEGEEGLGNTSSLYSSTSIHFTTIRGSG